MKKILSLLLLASLLFVTACQSALTIDTRTREPVPETKKTEIKGTETKTTEKEHVTMEKTKILFIGNSYTYYNDMPELLFAPIMREAGVDVSVCRKTKGGQYLIDSASAQDELGKDVDRVLQEEKFDVVILQEQSACPATKSAKFYDGVRALYQKIEKSGAKVVLYSTWGRSEGHKFLAEQGWTNEEMTWRLAASYSAIAEELGLDVAYVGLAFMDVYTKNADLIDLYNADLTHPSYEGSFLAAMTLAAKISGVNPTTLSFRGHLSEETATILKEAAKKAVFETESIPENYKTGSCGITMSASKFGEAL